MENKFIPGDVVEMKSGSMPMVVNTHGANFVECCWWDAIKGYQRFEFKEHQLKKHSPKKALSDK